jgi:ABC-2 type transport system permease protein
LSGARSFLIPFAVAIIIPAQWLAGLATARTLLAAAFTFALLGATRWFWRRGVRRYAGASA